MAHKYALPAPQGVETAAEDGKVIEIARVWINDGQPAIMVRPVFDDPRAMGQMLAELCWNYATAYEGRGFTQAQALDALKAGWVEGHANGDANLKAASR